MTEQPPPLKPPFCCFGEAAPDDARTRILETATRLFAEKGFAATSIREISQAAEVTNPTIYYYFGSKAGLFQSILSDSTAAIDRHVEEALSSASSFRDGLVAWLMAYFEAARMNPHMVRMHFAAALGLTRPPEGFDMRRIDAERRARLESMLDRGRALGVIQTDAPVEVLCNALGGCLLLPMLQFISGLRDSLNRSTAEHAIDLFLKGAAAPPSKEL